MNLGLTFTAIYVIGMLAIFLLTRFWSKKVGKSGNALSLGLTIGLVSYFIAIIPGFLLSLISGGALVSGASSISIVLVFAVTATSLCLARYFVTKFLISGGLTPSTSLYLGAGYAMFEMASPIVFGRIWSVAGIASILDVSMQVVTTLCVIVIFVCLGVIVAGAIVRKKKFYIVGLFLVQLLYLFPTYTIQIGIQLFASNLALLLYNVILAGAVFYYTKKIYNEWRDSLFDDPNLVTLQAEDPKE